ncbi:MAG: hypothetical protein L3J69_18435 [Desulfobacula sp.]|nr:hypothetical protein [Desulfobacula sp.]
MTFKTTIITVFIVFTFLSSGNAGTKWQYVTSMPNARYGHDVALGNDGKIYVMGGAVYDHKKIRKYNDGEFSNLVFDPVKNKWRVLEPVPGWIKNRNEFYYYDDTINNWIGVKKTEDRKDFYRVTWPEKQIGRILQISPEELKNTNFQRQGDGVAITFAIDGRIIWTGGNGKWAGPGENIVLPFDPVKGKWPETISKRIYYSEYSYGDRTVHQTAIPSMNERRMDHEAVTLSDGKIFVLGGYYEITKEVIKNRQFSPTGKTEVLNSVECYDPKTNTWEFKKPMFNKRYLFAAVVGRDNKIYVFGGCGRYNKKTRKFTVYNTTEVYDPETDTWIYRAPMPEGLFTIAGALGADGRIYIMGGSRAHVDDPPLRNVFIYDPIADSWEKGPSMNLPRSTLAAVATPDGKIYAIGGTDAGAYNKVKGILNTFLPQDKKLYEGQVQDTVEMLDTGSN